MKNNLVDIILPVYHEEGNIRTVLSLIKKHVHTPHKTYLILQDKKDPTIKVLNKLQNIYTFTVLFTPNGKGMMKAIKTGIKNTNSPLIILMMSDLSDDPKDIDAMVAKLSAGYDLVCACRYSNRGKRNGGPVLKGFLSHVACVSLKYITGMPTYDATNAFKGFRRSLIDQIQLESTEGFAFPLELSVKAYRLEKKFADIPTSWNDRKSGKSQFRIFTVLPHYLRWYLKAFLP